MKAQRTALATLAVFVVLSGVTQAQWVHRTTPGIPRLPNGQPNLNAPAPRTADGKPDVTAPAPKAADGHPDLSGVWMPNTRALQDLAVDMKPSDVPYQPWAEKVFKDRANGAKGKDDPAAHCVPSASSSNPCSPPPSAYPPRN